MMKRPETQTCSVTYYNKVMGQGSVKYVRGFGKKSEKRQLGLTDGQTDRRRVNLESPLVKPVGMKSGERVDNEVRLRVHILGSPCNSCWNGGTPGKSWNPEDRKPPLPACSNPTACGELPG